MARLYHQQQKKTTHQRDVTFACSLKIKNVGYRTEGELAFCRKSGVGKLFTGITPMFTSVFQDRSSPFPPPPRFQPKTNSTSFRKAAVTHVPTFQTACEMTSRWCIVAGPVLANKTIVYYYVGKTRSLW